LLMTSSENIKRFKWQKNSSTALGSKKSNFSSSSLMEQF
jgi:hypothetical protein